MFDFIESIKTAFTLLPPYLIFLAITLIVVPTIIGILLRLCLYGHLTYLGKKANKLLGGMKQGKQPIIVEQLEARVESATSHEQINTAALIDGAYSQEQFNFLFIPSNCEQVNYFTRMLPNLLLAFGLFGTFLGITINLASLSDTIGKVSISDISSLVQELNQPLQGMGIAFITSLIAITCSAILSVINLVWNTNLAKSQLLHYLEDYLDNIYLPQLPSRSSLDLAVDRLTVEFDNFLSRFGNTVQQALDQSLTQSVHQIVAHSKKTSELAETVYSGFLTYSRSIEKGSVVLRKAAHTFEQSQFADKLASATADLAIAQNQFSQSSLVLKKSTQSIENTLGTVQKSANKMLEIAEEISQINRKQAEIFNAQQKQTIVEKTGLQEIKSELANLVEKLPKN